MNRQVLRTARGRFAGRRGMAMFLVLMALAVAVLAGTTFLLSTATASQQGNLATQRYQAKLIAEAGLAMALKSVQVDPTWRSTRPNGTWVSNRAMAGGSYTLRGEDGFIAADGSIVGDGSLANNATDPVALTCVGTFGDARAIVRAVYTPAASGIAVKERAEFRNNSVIDSYSSAIGPYGPLNQGELGRISSNEIGKPNVVLRNRARVNGNLYVGAGGDPSRTVTVLDSAVVTGSLSALPSAVAFPEITEPTMAASTGSRTIDGNLTYISGDVHCGDLALKADMIRVIGNARFLVEGNCSVNGTQVQLGYTPTCAAATSGTIEVMDQAAIDSYDSSAGAYGGGNVGSVAVLTTTSTAASSISITGGTVNGSLYVAPGADPAVVTRVAGGAVTGERTALGGSLSLPAPPAWPSGLPASIGDYDKASGSYTISANMQVEMLRLTGGAKMVISGNRVIRVNKDLILDNTSKIEIASNSSLTLYVGQSVKLSASALVNDNTKNPTKLAVYCLGTDYEHTFGGSTRFYGVIDSPNSRLTMSDDSQIFGVTMVKSLIVKLRAKLHHDLNAAIRTVDARLPVCTTDNRLTIWTKANLTIEGATQLNLDTMDRSRVIFYHLPINLLEIKSTSQSRATIVAPEALCKVREQAVFNGLIRSRDLKVEATGVINADASGGPAAPGAIADETIELRDDAVVNGVGGTAAIGSNSAGTVVIYLKDYSVLKGDALGGPGGADNAGVKVGSNARITGRIYNLQVAETIEVPPTPVLQGGSTNREFKGVSSTRISGDINCTKFTIVDDAEVIVEGHTRVVCTGDVLFQKRGILRIEPGASIEIYCNKNVDIKEDCKINVGGASSKLVFNYSGTTNQQMENRSQFCGIIVAPLIEFKVKDDAQLYGALRTRVAKMEGRGKIHCDVSRARIAWTE